MSDDLEVILEEDPVVPNYKPNLPEALVYNFFERDPYTRRHRSRSMMTEANVPRRPNRSVTPSDVDQNGQSNVRLKSAEV